MSFGQHASKPKWGCPKKKLHTPPETFPLEEDAVSDNLGPDVAESPPPVPSTKATISGDSRPSSSKWTGYLHGHQLRTAA